MFPYYLTTHTSQPSTSRTRPSSYHPQTPQGLPTILPPLPGSAQRNARPPSGGLGGICATFFLEPQLTALGIGHPEYPEDQTRAFESASVGRRDASGGGPHIPSSTSRQVSSSSRATIENVHRPRSHVRTLHHYPESEYADASFHGRRKSVRNHAQSASDQASSVQQEQHAIPSSSDDPPMPRLNTVALYTVLKVHGYAATTTSILTTKDGEVLYRALQEFATEPPVCKLWLSMAGAAFSVTNHKGSKLLVRDVLSAVSRKLDAERGCRDCGAGKACFCERMRGAVGRLEVRGWQ
ncbi:hypothetical protein H0H81_007317 [Sphagnurus paluster]|uniref:Uncharacterized protein n=1 Tax=Sphagnurus paluster TaxID=117069 RepID=A0A9P7K7E8_9AGAR|nr:hypothetical protein H0H81_007317 [Sphagnurus paluster]